LSNSSLSERADDFDEIVSEALAALPPDIAERIDNVAIEVVDDDPGHPTRLGLYQGVPLTRRTSGYMFTLPDRITLYRRPIERVARGDPEHLRRTIRHVVVHELAHHFGISDERLRELGRY
jgi:predicted Zn-dependent protease with MMP-like domain